ncbi:MAG: protein kinase [Blastocatellia bacterium]|nr:protein kinase [Blastocatellia bacterium]MBN8725564.1 protein kinase [Acidobacteriota bacterium]
MSTCANPRCAEPKPSETGRCLTCQSLYINTLVRHRYEIKKIVGKGGFGTTYLIEDQDCFNELRILKELSPRSNEADDEDDLGITAERLFRREAQVLLNLQHPGIPKLYAYFNDNNYSYLVQDFIPGHTLAEDVDKHKHIFSEAEVQAVLLEVADILEYLHSRTPPIVHRDIKPQNLMRHSNGRLQLIDFGAVCLAAVGSNTGSQTLIGSPGYAPPEQIFGHPVPQSDLYAAGATALRLLTGVHPSQFFNNRTQQMEWQNKINISPEFTAILSDLLVRDAKKRLSSASELKARLEKLISNKNPNIIKESSIDISNVSSNVNFSKSSDTLPFPQESFSNLNTPSTLFPVEVKTVSESQETSAIEIELSDIEAQQSNQLLSERSDESGDLQQNSIIFLLKKFHQEKASGLLVFTNTHEHVNKTVYLDNGLVVFASSSIKTERLGEWLLSIRRITQKDFLEASELMKLSNIRFGTALVRIGVLQAEELKSLVIEQVSNIVYSLFNWTSGQYQFWRTIPPKEDIKISISSSEIILQGLQRLENTILLKSWLGDLSRKLAITNNQEKLYKSVKLDPKQAFVVSRIDRPMSIEEILTMGGLPETEILKTIYGLISIGVLEWSLEKETPKEIPKQELSIKPLDTKTKPASPSQAEFDIQSAAAFCYEVENTLRHFEDANYYSVLEVDKDASLLQIQTAYARLSQKFHPDHHIKLSKYNLSIKNELEKVFGRLTEACHTLSNPKLREEYDLSLRKTIIKSTNSSKLEKARTEAERPSIPNSSTNSSIRTPLPFPKIDAVKPSTPQNSLSNPSINQTITNKSTNAPAKSSPAAPLNLQNLQAETKPAINPTKVEQPSKTEKVAPRIDSLGSSFRTTPKEEAKPTPSRLGTPSLPPTPMAADGPRSTATASAKSWFQKGLDYYNSSLIGQACRAFQAAVTADPQQAEYHIYLARSLAQMKDFYMDAEQEFYKAIELAPKNPDYFAELGLFYQKINMARQAEEMFSKALELNPNHPVIQFSKQKK